MTANRGGVERSWVGRWAWLLVLGVGIGLYIAVRQALVITGNPRLVPSLLVLGVLVIPVSFVVYVDGRHPVYDVPLSVLLSCALLGAVLGAAVAGVLEFDTARWLDELPPVSVGVIEEAAKLLVPIAILIFTRYRARTADGLLIGIGNLYKTGMCFLLGVSPWIGVRDVDPDAAVALARRLLVANANRPEQSTTGELARGKQHWVYERAGKPCRRCGERVLRAVQGEGVYARHTYYCPRCQPGPRPRQ